MNKLTSLRPSGYRGKFGWRNYFGFLFKKSQVTYIPPNVIVPISQQDKLPSQYLQLYPVHVKLRIPEVSGKQFLFIGLIIFILISIFIFYSAIILLKEDFEYRQAIRNEMEYRMGNAMIPYETKMELLKQQLVEVEAKVSAVMTPKQIERSIEIQEAKSKKWIEQAHKNKGGANHGKQ